MTWIAVDRFDLTIYETSEVDGPPVGLLRGRGLSRHERFTEHIGSRAIDIYDRR